MVDTIIRDKPIASIHSMVIAVPIAASHVEPILNWIVNLMAPILFMLNLVILAHCHIVEGEEET
jgi:hypothetical protein